LLRYLSIWEIHSDLRRSAIVLSPRADELGLECCFSLPFSDEEACGSQPPLGEYAHLSTVVLFRRLFQVVSLFKYFVSLVITSTHLSFGLVMFKEARDLHSA
jgi:hypothetical protein